MNIIMKILILSEKKKELQSLIDSLNKDARTDYLHLSKIMLVSEDNTTKIKALGKELKEYDAVFIQARTSLSNFIEPLLEELEKIGSYTNIKKGSYYLGENEPYLTLTLATNNISVPKTISTGSIKNIDSLSKKTKCPLLIKTFFGKKNQQVLLVNSKKELQYFVKSIKTEIDGVILREFIQKDIISCIVIGEKVFSIKRKYVKAESKKISKGKKHKLTQKEKELVINTAKIIGYDIARVDLAKGKILKVKPIIPFKEFDLVYKNKIEKEITSHLIKKALEQKSKKIMPYDFFGIRKFISENIIEAILNKWIKVKSD